MDGVGRLLWERVIISTVLSVGPWRFFNFKGDMLAEGSYKAGLPNGLWRYFDGVTIKSGHYESGLRHGAWVSATPEGGQQRATYRRGEH
jgi:hypothetical protein